MKRTANKNLLYLIIYSGVPGVILWLYPVLKPIWSVRTTEETFTHVGLLGLLQILYYGVAFIVGLYGIYRTKAVVFRMVSYGPVQFFILYLLLGWVSLLWSPRPEITLWRLLQSTSLAMIIILVTARFKGKFSEYIRWALYWAMFAAVVEIVRRLTNSYVAPTLRGELHNAGVFTLAPLFGFVLYYMRGKLFKLVCITIAILATATKVYLGMFAGLMCVTLMTVSSKHKHKYDRYLAGLHIIIVSFLVLIWLSFGSGKLISLLFYGKEQIAIETGTGRTIIFRHVWEAIKDHPLGYGYGAERFLGWIKGFDVELSFAHNIILDSYTVLGVLGVFCMSMMFIKCFIASLKMEREVKYAFIFSTVVMLFFSFFSCSLAVNVSSAWISMLILISIPSLLALERKII